MCPIKTDIFNVYYLWHKVKMNLVTWKTTRTTSKLLKKKRMEVVDFKPWSKWLVGMCMWTCYWPPRWDCWPAGPHWSLSVQRGLPSLQQQQLPLLRSEGSEILAGSRQKHHGMESSTTNSRTFTETIWQQDLQLLTWKSGYKACLYV